MGTWREKHICLDCGKKLTGRMRLCVCKQQVDRGMGFESCEEKGVIDYEPDPDLDGGCDDQE